MKKLISSVLILTLLAALCLPFTSSAADDGEAVLLPKGSDWDYLIYDYEDETLLPPPEGWLDGSDGENWETAQAPFAGHSWPSSLANTVLPYTYYSLYCRKTFTVEDLSSIKGLKMEIIYDENPTVFINGSQVWSATGYKDGAYTSVDIEFFADYLVEGTNTICVAISNINGGGIMDCALTADVRERLVDKETTWRYICSDDSEAQAPANWTTGDTTGWSEGTSPFAGSAWPNMRAKTKFEYGSFAAWLRKDFTVENAAAITSLTMGIIYDEDPAVYLNGTLVWSATGYKDAGYTVVDLSDYIGLLVNGTNKLAVSFRNSPTGGGSVLGLELYADTEVIKPINDDGTVAVRSVFSFGSDGSEKHNPWGAIGGEDNLFDGSADSVWGWGYEQGMGVELRFFDAVSLTSLFLQTKNEGKMAGSEEAHGVYTVALRDETTGEYKTVGTLDALIAGATLDLGGAVTSGIRVTVDEWYNDNWGSIAELVLLGEEASGDPFDLDGNGKVDISDVTALLNLLAGSESGITGEPDLDGDANVTISDVTALLNHLAAG